jgi:hypothetical protein
MIGRALNALAVASSLILVVTAVALSSGTATSAQNEGGAPFVLQQITAQLTTLQAQVNALQPRKYYLSMATSDGADATAACEAGFHMASLWEIYDPSSLRYDTARGYMEADSGAGPPADELGWVRTGRAERVANGPGDANCNAYTSNNPADQGRLVQLEDDWEQEVGPIPPWQAFPDSCGQARRVWCVQN